MGQWQIGLDVGSPIAMHLQEIGLIEKALTFPCTTYQIVPGLPDLCIKKPSLLHIPEDAEEAALREMEKW